MASCRRFCYHADMQKEPVPALPVDLCPCRYKLWAILGFGVLMGCCTLAALIGLLPLIKETGNGVIIALAVGVLLIAAILFVAARLLITRRASVMFTSKGVCANPLVGGMQCVDWHEITSTEITGNGHYSTLVLHRAGASGVLINCHMLGEQASELQRWVDHWRKPLEARI